METVSRLHGSEGGFWSAAESLKRLQADGPPLRRIEGGGPLPLSFAEERLWFLGRSHPASPADNVSLAWRLEGACDAALLERSLRNVVARHEALRTTFPVLEGKAVAVVGDGAGVALRIEDVAGACEGAWERETLERAREEARRPFDLERGPLFRAVLYRRGAGMALFVFTVHQIVFDGFSVRLLGRDLAESYRALAAGTAPSLPELPVRYTDYAAWQRTFVEQDVLAADVGYWSEALGAPYASMSFPGTSPPSASIGPAVRSPWSLGAAETDRLRQIARSERATDFMVVVAGLQALLHRRSRAEDVVVFASTAGRVRPEVRNLVGLFANVLPLRVGLGGRPTFREIVRRVRSVVLSGFAHQELPFQRIVEHLRIRGDRNQSVFQAMVIFQNGAAPAHALPGLTFAPVDGADNGAARFHLLLDVADAKDGLRGSIKVRTDVFPEDDVARLGDDLRSILEAAGGNPDAKVADLPVSSAGAAVAAPRPGVAARSPESSPGVAPRDTLERQLLSVWRDVFESSSIGVRDDFFDLGGESFKAVHIVGRIEALTGRNLPLVTLLEAPTVERLATLLRDEGWKPLWSSLVPIRPGGSRPPFYCVHGVGGNILEFEHLGRYLDPDQPLYGIQAQGLDGKMPRLRSVEEMAAHYVTEIRELQPHGPYYLGGSSFGGLVAWEVSQRLRAQGEEVGLLVMFDTHGPGFPQFLPKATGLRKRWGDFRYRVELHAGNIAASKGARWEYVRTKAGRLRRQLAQNARRRFRETVERLTLPRTIREVGESGAEANRAYEPLPYPGKVALLRATEQPYGIVPDSTNGWRALAVGTLEVRDVPGHHGAIMREPRVRILAHELDACLLEAQALHAPGRDVRPVTSAR